MKMPCENFPQRPAWTEIDLGSLRRNLHLIRADLPPHVKLIAVAQAGRTVLNSSHEQRR